MCLLEAVAQHPLQAACGPRAGSHPAGSERFVGVEIHDPEHKLATLYADKERPEPGDEGWGRHGDNQVDARLGDQMAQTVDQVTSEVGIAPPASRLAEAKRVDAPDPDAAPDLVPGVLHRGVVVHPSAAHDADVVATVRQIERKV